MIPLAAGTRLRSPRAAPLARAALALLVAASVAAFFFDQALKGKPPLVNRHGGVTRFHPGGPAPRQAHFHLRLTVGDFVDIVVLNARTQRPVAVIAHHRRVREYRTFELVWDGTTTAGATAPPGRYLVEVRLERGGESVVVPDFELVVEGRSP